MAKNSAALWESVELYRVIVESARDFAIFTVDLKNQITSWNRGAKRILGYSEDEAAEMSGADIFTAEDRKKKTPEKEMANARREGKAEDERWHVKKSGARFWGSGLMMQMRNERGKILGYLKILRDLTDRKQAQEKRRN